MLSLDLHVLRFMGLFLGHVRIRTVGVVKFDSLLPFRELTLCKNQRVVIKTKVSKFGNQKGPVRGNQKLLKDQLIMLQLSPHPPYLNTDVIFVSSLEESVVCCILDENHIAI